MTSPCEQAARTFAELLRASRAVLSRVEPSLAASGLTPTQFGVMEALLHRGSLTQRALGRAVLTSAANMTDVVDKLEARGLLSRCRVATDRRSVQVDLTPCGRAMITELFPRYTEDLAGVMASLSGAELGELGLLLHRLATALEDGGPLRAPATIAS